MKSGAWGTMAMMGLFVAIIGASINNETAYADGPAVTAFRIAGTLMLIGGVVYALVCAGIGAARYAREWYPPR